VLFCTTGRRPGGGGGRDGDDDDDDDGFDLEEGGGAPARGHGGRAGTAEERSRAMAAGDRLSRSSDQIQRSLEVRAGVRGGWLGARRG
jgi:hypothetical protein